MAGYRELVVLLILSAGGDSANIDPCNVTTHKIINDPHGYRHPNNYQNVTLCDATLPYQWYRVNSSAGDVMATRCLQRGQCATNNPVWLNGSIPEQWDGVVTRNVCLTFAGICCVKTKSIQIRNCGAYFLYKLPSTEFCPSAYCFGGRLTGVSNTTRELSHLNNTSINSGSLIFENNGTTSLTNLTRTTNRTLVTNSLHNGTERLSNRTVSANQTAIRTPIHNGTTPPSNRTVSANQTAIRTPIHNGTTPPSNITVSANQTATKTPIHNDTAHLTNSTGTKYTNRTSVNTAMPPRANSTEASHRVSTVQGTGTVTTRLLKGVTTHQRPMGTNTTRGTQTMSTAHQAKKADPSHTSKTLQTARTTRKTPTAPPRHRTEPPNTGADDRSEGHILDKEAILLAEKVASLHTWVAVGVVLVILVLCGLIGVILWNRPQRSSSEKSSKSEKYSTLW